jgi:hypothetical protein
MPQLTMSQTEAPAAAQASTARSSSRKGSDAVELLDSTAIFERRHARQACG